MLSKVIKNKLHAINIDKEKLRQERELSLQRKYESKLKDENNLSYWYPKVKDAGFKVPKTVVIPIDYEEFRWMSEDGGYRQEDMDNITAKVKWYLESEDFDTNRGMFLKSGTYSGKFSFDLCKLDNIDDVGLKFTHLNYDSMIIGAGESTEIVIREYIKAKEERPTIYNGMPLNTEFRVFYDFDKKEVLGVFNYWDTEVMLNSLNPVGKSVRDEEHAKIIIKEYESFKSCKDVLESEFTALKENLAIAVSKNMVDVCLEGIWSIDFMYVDGEMYLIDMALGHKSYYWDRVKSK